MRNRCGPFLWSRTLRGNAPGCQPRKRRWACTGFRKSLEEGKLQSDSGVLWNMLEDLNLLILNYIPFFPRDRSLVLWHNGVKLTASWELTFAPPLTLTVLQSSSMPLSFLERLLNANQGVLSGVQITFYLSRSVQWSCFYIKVILYFWNSEYDLTCQIYFFFNCYYTGLASFVFISQVHVKFVK